MYEENTYWKNVLTIVPIVGSGVATIIYFLRLFARRVGGTTRWQLEDILMGIGVLISYGATAFVVYSQSNPPHNPIILIPVKLTEAAAFNGVGLPTSTLPPDERRRVQFGSWMIQKFWAPSMAFIKISIIVFLRRLLGTLTFYRAFTMGLIVFVTCWALAALLVNIFQCWPVQYYYDKDLNGHCMGHQREFFQCMGSLALIEDVFILCLPIPVVWRLKITMRQKFAVTFVFSLGGLVCIFSLLRLIEFRRFIVTDLASSSALESIWTVLEINVAIITGSLPLLRPLLQGILGRMRSISNSKRSHHSNSRYYHRPSMPTPPGDLHKYFDPRPLDHSTTVKSSVKETIMPPDQFYNYERDDDGHRTSDVELHGIAVTTGVDQDVEDKSDIGNAEPVSNRNWPL